MQVIRSLRVAFASWCRWIRAASGPFGRAATEKPRSEDDYGQSRARFWTEMRAGQREAEVQNTRLDSARLGSGAGMMPPTPEKEGGA
ncbi:MAG: hypothetical protein ABI629_13140 [bacterium]